MWNALLSEYEDRRLGPFLSCYLNTSVLFSIFFNHFLGRFLSDTRVSWNSCWEGSFSLSHGLSCGIDIAQCSSLSLSQHELPIFGKASFIWMSATSVSCTCSEYWSYILGENPLGSIVSWRSVIKSLSLDSIIGSHWKTSHVNNYIL